MAVSQIDRLRRMLHNGHGQVLLRSDFRAFLLLPTRLVSEWEEHTSLLARRSQRLSRQKPSTLVPGELASGHFAGRGTPVRCVERPAHRVVTSGEQVMAIGAEARGEGDPRPIRMRVRAPSLIR